MCGFPLCGTGEAGRTSAGGRTGTASGGVAVAVRIAIGKVGATSGGSGAGRHFGGSNDAVDPGAGIRISSLCTRWLMAASCADNFSANARNDATSSLN